MTESRKKALLWLLEDWEAGRMTSMETLGNADYDLWMDSYVAHGWRGWRCLTPAGLAAARAIREGKDG